MPARPIALDTREWAKSKVISHFIGARRRVLDAGCGAGENAAVLREAGCFVHGVDLDPARLALAEQCCDSVSIGDVTTEAFWQTAGSFDVVLFSDVLEHLLNPEQVLCYARQYCSPVSIVVSLPT